MNNTPVEFLKETLRQILPSETTLNRVPKFVAKKVEGEKTNSTSKNFKFLKLRKSRTKGNFGML